jgi:hypothetical protein
MPHVFLLSNDDEQYFNHVNGVCIVVVLTISAFFSFSLNLNISPAEKKHPESKGQKRVTLFLIIKLGKTPLSLKTPLNKAYDTENSPADILYEPLKHQVLQILFDL